MKLRARAAAVVSLVLTAACGARARTDEAPAVASVATASAHVQAAPDSPTQLDHVEWLDAGNLRVPNPGWTPRNDGDVGVLVGPSDKGGLAFTHFRTADEARDLVREFSEKLGMKDLVWEPVTKIVLGPDRLPATFAEGRGKDANGVPGKMFYVLIETGETYDVFAMGGADADAGAVYDQALSIVRGVRRKESPPRPQ